MGLIVLSTLIRNAHDNGSAGDHIRFRLRRCGIEPLMYQALDCGLLDPTLLDWDPETARQKLTRFKITQSARIALWTQTLRKSAEILDFPYIVLKGFPLGLRLTGSPMWRDSNDLDLWIDEVHRDLAVTRLQSIGYKIAVEPHLWATNQILMEHDTLVPVELHWKLAPPPYPAPSFDAAFKRHTQITMKDLEIPVLSDPDLWIHLLLHAHQHYLALKTFMDCLIGAQTLVPDPSLIRQYSLSKLDHLIQTMINTYKQPATISSKDAFIMMATNLWFDQILTSHQRGELVFGEDSKTIAALGVCLKSASMGILDGKCEAISAACQVILNGPHRLGAWLNRHVS